MIVFGVYVDCVYWLIVVCVVMNCWSRSFCFCLNILLLGCLSLVTVICILCLGLA